MEPHQPAQLAPTGVVAGLSIDDGLLRVVVVERDEQPAVVDDAEADLAADVVVHGVVRNVAALARRIGELWQALGLGGVPTHVGIHPHDAELRTVLVRGWPEDGWPAEVARVVDGVHRRYGEAVVWHAAPLWRDQAVAARVAATRRSAVAAVVAAARLAGVWVAGVELSGLAMERALERIAPPFTLVVDRTGPGPATLLLLDHGVAVLGWRGVLPREAAGAGELKVYLLDEATAVAMAQGAVPADEWLLSPPSLSDRRAALLRPGAGLAAGSPAPPAGFAVPVGLALGAAGVGTRPLELQGPLLQADEEARRGPRPRRLAASSVPAALVAEALAAERGGPAEPAPADHVGASEAEHGRLDEDEPVDAAPVEDRPAGDAPVEDRPAGDAPVEDRPAGDAPVEEDAVTPMADAAADEPPPPMGPLPMDEPAPVDDAPVAAEEPAFEEPAVDPAVPEDRGDEDPGSPPGGSPVEPVEPAAPAAPAAPANPGGPAVAGDDGADFAEALRAAWGARPPVRRIPEPPPPPSGLTDAVAAAGEGPEGPSNRPVPEVDLAAAVAPGAVTVRPTLLRGAASGRTLREAPIGPVGKLVPLPVTPMVPEAAEPAAPAVAAAPVPENAATDTPEVAGAVAATPRRRTRRTVVLAAVLGTGAFLVARAVGGEPDLTPETVEGDPVDGERQGRVFRPGAGG
ncbi:MAG: hypothetical protein AB7O92_14585 [Acidimicrobiia bacterium]